MAAEDYITGISITDSKISYHYTTYRIDYFDERSVGEFIDMEQYDAAIKNTPLGYDGHKPKPNYTRKVLIGSGSDADAARDAIVSAFEEALDGDGIGYTVEEITVSNVSKEAISDYGAKNALEVHDAVKWAQAIEDLEATHITMTDFQRGRNPHRGYQFGGPQNKEVGRELARDEPEPGPDRYEHPDPIETHDST
jgi:hypothetical protein